MTVIDEIAAERRRQIDVEGWTPEHDSKNNRFGELALAAAEYAMFSRMTHSHRRMHVETAPRDWPWHKEWWKPRTPRQDLIRAAALIVAEIERLDRLESVNSPGDGETTMGEW